MSGAASEPGLTNTWKLRQPQRDSNQWPLHDSRRHNRAITWLLKGVSFISCPRSNIFLDIWATIGTNQRKPLVSNLVQLIRHLTWQDGWKTQDGRMTKKCGARLHVHSQSYAISFRHSAVLSFPAVLSVPAVLLCKLPIQSGESANYSS